MMGLAWGWAGMVPARLRIELSEVLRVHPLEVLLQLVGLEAGVWRRLVGLDPGLVEEMIAGEDGGAEPERERDAVGGTSIHLEHVIVPADEQLGEVGVFLHRADHDAAEVAAQPDDELLHEIVRERALRLHALQLHGDRARFRRPDPDGQDAGAVLFAENDHRGVRGPIQPQVGHSDFDHCSSRGAYRAAERSAFTRSVSSQVNSWTVRPSYFAARGRRPKWPYDAVGPKIGRLSLRVSMMARGLRSNTSRTICSSRRSGSTPVRNVSTMIEPGSATPMA